MKRRNRVFSLVAGLGVVSSVAVAACDSPPTGQPGEPAGPLMVTKLTLLDTTSRPSNGSGGLNLFTDTSAPADCTQAAAAASAACQDNPVMDTFGLIKSQPSPDSDDSIRVVFNKIPELWKGQQLELVTQMPNMPPTAVCFNPAAAASFSLACDDGPTCGVPTLFQDVSVSGAPESPDPSGNIDGVPIPYGPALVLSNTPPPGCTTAPADPLAALETDSNYHVNLDPGLSGRDGTNDLLQYDAAAMALLKFHTEPFQIVQVGAGLATDPYFFVTPNVQPMSVPPVLLAPPSPLVFPTSFDITSEPLPGNGVVAVKFNAPIDLSALTGTSVTASLAGTPVPVTLSLSMMVVDATTMKMMCESGNGHTLYIAPQAGTWGAAGALTLTVTGGDLRELSQLPMHPAGMGRHALTGTLTIKAMNTGMMAASTYGGVTAAAVCQ